MTSPCQNVLSPSMPGVRVLYLRDARALYTADAESGSGLAYATPGSAGLDLRACFDAAEVTLYNILENDIIPDFYDRGHGGIPRTWVRRMKAALRELAPAFNSHRMVMDYAGTAYAPALHNFNELTQRDFAPARELSEWRMDIMTKWSMLQIRNVRAQQADTLHVGDALTVEAEILLNGIDPGHIRAEIYAGHLNQDNSFAHRELSPMQHVGQTDDGWQVFRGTTAPAEAGRYGFTVRVCPTHPRLADPHSLGLIRWAGV